MPRRIRSGQSSLAILPESSVHVVMQLADALDRFTLQLQANGRSRHTIDQYTRHGRLLIRWCGEEGVDPSLGALDHEAVARFLASPVARRRADGRPKHASTLNAIRVSLRALLRYLHEAGLTQANLGRLIQTSAVGEPPPRALSADEVRRFTEALRQAPRSFEVHRDRALFLTFLRAGTRLHATVQAEAEDLDLQAGELVLRRCKAGQEHRVFLAEDLREALEAYLGDRATGPIFQTRHGRRITTRQVQRRLAWWLERAGCRPASPHALRHTFAMGLYRETRDVLLVRRALGHRSLASTLRYAQASDDELRAAIHGRETRRSAG